MHKLKLQELVSLEKDLQLLQMKLESLLKIQGHP
jgi:hypothetical protein